VLGTATPLYTLMLAGAARLGLAIPPASAAIGIAAATLALVIVALWLTRLTGSGLVGLLAALVVASQPAFVTAAVSGLETSVYVLALILCVQLYDRERFALAALAAAAATLVRLEGAMAGASLMLHFIASRRRPPTIGATLGYVLPVLPWLVFSLLYFGEILPRPLQAIGPSTDSGAMLRQAFGPDLLPLWPLAIVGALVPLVRRTPASAGLQALALWIAIALASFGLSQPDLSAWNLAPLTTAVAVLAVFGAAEIFRVGETLTPVAPRTRSGVAAAVVVILPLLAAGTIRTTRDVEALVERTSRVEKARADAAAFVRREGQPGDAVTTGAIGIVGWTTRGPIHDTRGIVTPSATGLRAVDLVARSASPWFITEVDGPSAPTPAVTGYTLAATFNETAAPTLLVFRRGPATETSAGMVFTAGISMTSVTLTTDRVEVALTADRRLDRHYKIFFHLFEDGIDDDTPTRLLDFDPTTATVGMTPGVTYVSQREIAPALSTPLTVVKLGLFDERDPAYARLTDAKGRSHIVMRLRGPITR